MPVFKYRDVSEMSDVWRQSGDPALFRAIARLWAMSAALAPRRFPPGVHRARSVSESNTLAEAWNETAARTTRRSG